MLETIKSGLPPERRAAQIYKNKETEETNMDDMNMEITTSEHRAIVFKMNRKQAAAGRFPTPREVEDQYGRP